MLRERAVALGADLRLGTELVRFEQDDTGVTAWLRERSRHEYTLRAAYTIAADGSRSRVRESLGLGREGPDELRVMRSVLFRAPLDQYLEKGISQFEIDQPDFKAFLTTYVDGRWVLMMDDVERDEAQLRAAIEGSIGRSDLPIEIITTGRWELSALITDRFSAGRAFLAGDAAHTLPPTRGGFGANTGIRDVYDLAWKLAGVLAGDSTSALLDTYDAERRPVAWERLRQTFARPDYSRFAPEYAAGVPILGEAAMEFGQLCRSAAVIGAGDDLPAPASPTEWAGEPGTRAPHVRVERAGEPISTLDLFGRNWVLIAEDERWIDAARAAAGTLGITVDTVRPGVDAQTNDPDAFHRAFGIGSDGASLIRPDGYIAWRSVGLATDAAGVLTSALGDVSCTTRRS